MKAFLSFLLMVALALCAAALVAYPAYLGLHDIIDKPFHRFVRRGVSLFMLIALIVLIVRWRLGTRAALGYGVTWRKFLQDAALAFGLGLLILLPVMVFLFATGIRVWQPSGFDAVTLAGIAGGAFLSGLVVAWLEETFARGALYSAIQRESGAAAAIVLTSLVYAFAHFLRSKSLPTPEVHWWSGFPVVAQAFVNFPPLSVVLDSLLALFAVGTLLAVLRMRTGHIGAAIGLHAAWVTMIITVRKSSVVDEQAALGFLVGSYDGVIGWLVTGWTLLILAIVLKFRPERRIFSCAPGA